MVDTSSYQNQSKTLEEALKDAKEEKDDTGTLDDKIREAGRKIIRTELEHEVYAASIRLAYEKVKEVDPESIPLLWDLIKTMESIPNLDIQLKKYILDSIWDVTLDAETYQDRRERIIQNLRRGIEILTNEKGLLKINELYSLILDGKIPLQNFDEYLKKVRNWAYELDQETQIRYARREVAYDYLEVIIKGLLINPTKYEPLYKQFIETDNLEEFVKHLPKYIKKD
jgi:hypothetical protein